MNDKEILMSVVDELGLDINYVYKEGKHSITDDIVAGVAASIIFEFLKGSYNLNMIGPLIRSEFDAIRSKLTKGDVGHIRIEPQHIHDLLDIVLEGENPFTDDFKEKAEERVLEYLIELRIPKKAAKEKSKKIVKKLSKILRK